MTNAEDMAKQYAQILKKFTELRDLLMEILLKFEVINEDNNESFYQLLSYVPSISTITPYSGNAFTDTSSKHFQTEQEINDYLHHEGHTAIACLEHTLPEINLLLVQKIDAYRHFLRQYLLNVGLDLEIVDSNFTLRHFIECLYKIQRQRNTKIIIDQNTILYRITENKIGIIIQDDMGETLEEGTICISENGGILYYGPIQDAFIQPFTQGDHTYTFTFIPEDYNGISYYKTSNLTLTLNVVATPIFISIKSENINQQSIYYHSENTGYGEDQWQITVQTKNQVDNIISNIPFKAYIDNEMIYEGITNILGECTFLCYLPHSSNFADLETVLTIQTFNINPAFSNAIQKRYFTIYHHTLEIDDQYYIGQPNGVQIRLIDQLTGEPITTIPAPNVDDGYEEYDPEEIIDDDYSFDNENNTEENTIPHPLLNARLSIEATFNNQSNVFMLDSVDDGIWIIDDLNVVFELSNNDIVNLYINTDEYQEYQNLYVKSNFILPNTNHFYMNDTPQIYFKPLGELYTGFLTGTVTTRDNTISRSFTVVDSLIDNTYFSDLGEHTVHFESDMENVDYSFTIERPFVLEQTNYNPITCATYRLEVFDKEAVKRLEGHQIGVGYEQYTIQTPNEFSIELLNDGYSVISIYDSNVNILDIINEYNSIQMNEETPITLSKNNTDWNKISFDFDNTYKVYLDNTLIKTITEQHEELEIYIIIPADTYYRNVKIKVGNKPFNVINNDEEAEYAYTKTETENSYIYNINVCRDPNKGRNTICATTNNYTKCDAFDLYDKTFFIVPDNNRRVGNNDIEIKCLDDSINNITITHNNVAQNSVTKNDDTFIVNCDIYEAGELTITITDDNNNSETYTLNVQKGNYTIDLNMPDVKEYHNHDPIPLSIKDAFNQEVNTFYCFFDNEIPILITKTNNNIILENTAIGRQFDDLQMGDHYITIRTIENNNYYGNVFGQLFTLGVYISSLTDHPLFTDLSVDNDGWLLNETILADSETTIGDLESVLVGINTTVNVDPGQLLLSNFISSDPDLDSIILLDDDFTNIQDAIIDIDIDNDQLTYNTIEDDE